MANALRLVRTGDREVVFTRSFDAPRALVWEAMSKPELLKRWCFGPPGWAMTVCEEDARVGGSFRWEWVGPGGEQLTMTGVYTEYAPPGRVVRSETFEMPGGPPMGTQLATLELADRGETTLLTITLAYDSKEAMAGALGSGMEGGMAAGYDRLDEVLAAGVS